MIKVSTTGMAVSLKTDLRFPISGQWGHGDRIIQYFTNIIELYKIWNDRAINDEEKFAKDIRVLTNKGTVVENK